MFSNVVGIVYYCYFLTFHDPFPGIFIVGILQSFLRSL